MADTQIGNPFGLPISAKATAPNFQNLNTTGNNPMATFADTDMASIAAMRSRLTAISSTSYSPDRLNTMSYNDMVYAIRLHDHAGTF